METAPSRYLFTFTVAGPAAETSPSTASGERHSYDPSGFWEGPLHKSGIYGAFVSGMEPEEVEALPLTSLDQTYFSIDGYTLYAAGKERYLLCGTTLGNILVYRIDGKNQRLVSLGHAVDPLGTAHRNPAVHGFPAFFKGPDAKGLIVSSEGGIFFYKIEGKTGPVEPLVLEKPFHLLQENPDLYGGSLVVPGLADWDGDGDLDIVSGTSLGHIYLFENQGDNAAPEFGIPETLKAGGYDIHIQSGYNQTLQGPVESRWGYSCPSVYDWNGDGLPDVLTGDARAKFNIYVNTGTKTSPRLEPEHPLYAGGLDLFGTWRVQPGVGKLGKRNAYIHLDKEDELHLYWQADTYNLEDGGKLTIGDSIPIRANFRRGGETGRCKIVIV
ncbi:MAG TPA: VCBS repeat-containing protein, partial [Anseongella sp.]|nr:VCBS repeat-containing protein [Anseongella sp.]